MNQRATFIGLAALLFGLASTVFAGPVQWKAADFGNDHWYERVDIGITWADADAAAKAAGGYLVTVTSAEENLFLTNTEGLGVDSSIQATDMLHYHWLGGYKDPVDYNDPAANWHWVTNESFIFNNWPAGEPNNDGGDENALVFDHDFTVNGKDWNDLPNQYETSGYIMEWDKTPPVPDAGGVTALFFVMTFGVLALRRRL